MKFDDFIQCCVMIKGLTESFQRLDVQRTGVVNINYETVSTAKQYLFNTHLRVI